jgi:hypothetical protein
MLRQTISVVCEKVITSADGQISLINLFDTMTVQLPPELGELPKDAVAPRDWAVFSKWDTEPGDELLQYVFCLQMLYPDERQFGEITRLNIKTELNKRAQVTANVSGFPVGQAGTFKVRNWLEVNGKPVVEAVEIKLEVQWNRTPAPEPPKSTPVQ